jgi:hypothetical protein
MAAPDATVSRLGDINSAGTPFDELFLTQYSGMVMTAFNKKQTTMNRHVVRTISQGHEAQFPALGTVTAGYHTAGQVLENSPVFKEVLHAQRVIAIDGLLISPIFIDVLDEAMNHYDVRAPYAEQQGQALANEADQRVLRSFVAASRTSTPTVTGLPGGDRITGATIGTDASVLKAGIYDAAEDLDEHNVPAEERYLWVAPSQFYLLLQDGEFIDRDFNNPNGSKARADTFWAANFEVIKTNNLPSADDSANADLPSDLQLDYQTTVAVSGHKSAAGTVKLLDLKFESEYDIDRQGTILVAKYAMGHNFLRPEAAVELATS